MLFTPAPTTTLNGDLSVLEGESVSVTCDYDDVYPQGNQSIFYYGDVEVVLEKVNLQLVIILDQNVSNRWNSCGKKHRYRYERSGVRFPSWSKSTQCHPQLALKTAAAMFFQSAEPQRRPRHSSHASVSYREIINTWFGKWAAFLLLQNQQFTIPKIKRSDNRKPIFCKALTVLTERFSNAGRSAIRYINVTCKY